MNLQEITTLAATPSRLPHARVALHHLIANLPVDYAYELAALYLAIEKPVKIPDKLNLASWTGKKATRVYFNYSYVTDLLDFGRVQCNTNAHVLLIQRNCTKQEGFYDIKTGLAVDLEGYQYPNIERLIAPLIANMSTNLTIDLESFSEVQTNVNKLRKMQSGKYFIDLNYLNLIKQIVKLENSIVYVDEGKNCLYTVTDNYIALVMMLQN